MILNMIYLTRKIKDKLVMESVKCCVSDRLRDHVYGVVKWEVRTSVYYKVRSPILKHIILQLREHVRKTNE